MSDVKGIYVGGTPINFKDETSRNLISDVYDPTKQYEIGDYCINNNKLFIATDRPSVGGFDGSCWKETTMSAEVTEQNKNFAKSTNNWAEAYANAKIKIDVCLEYYYANKYITLTITIPVNKMAIGKTYASGYYFNASSNAVAEVTIKSSTELTKVVYVKELGQTITNTTFIYY